jgi:hypothetical protein
MPKGRPFTELAKHPFTRRKLHSLRMAVLPRDLDEFRPWDEYFRRTPEGRTVCDQWRQQIQMVKLFPNLTTRPEVTENIPTALFLPFLQIHLLKTDNSRFEAALDRPRSPKWQEADRELNPLRAAEIRAAAAQEDAQAKAQRESTLYGPDSLVALLAAAEGTNRRRPQDHTPNRPRVRLWFDPMSVNEYVEATAVSRKTVEEFLGTRRRPRRGCRTSRRQVPHAMLHRSGNASIRIYCGSAFSSQTGLLRTPKLPGAPSSFTGCSVNMPGRMAVVIRASASWLLSWV